MSYLPTSAEIGDIRAAAAAARRAKELAALHAARAAAASEEMLRCGIAHRMLDVAGAAIREAAERGDTCIYLTIEPGELFDNRANWIADYVIATLQADRASKIYTFSKEIYSETHKYNEPDADGGPYGPEQTRTNYWPAVKISWEV